jgi:hypothetical protein
MGMLDTCRNIFIKATGALFSKIINIELGEEENFHMESKSLEFSWLHICTWT